VKWLSSGSSSLWGNTEVGVGEWGPKEQHGGETTGVRSERLYTAWNYTWSAVPQLGEGLPRLCRHPQVDAAAVWQRPCLKAVAGAAPVLQKATQISNVPFVDESSGSDDDCGSQASFRMSVPCSEYRKTSGLGSPRAIKRGTERERRLESLPAWGPYQFHPQLQTQGIPAGNESLASLIVGIGRDVGPQP
jgi:hypothetical protein